MKMIHPGTAGTYSVPDGTSFVPGSDGSLDVPIKYVPALAALGWRVAPANLVQVAATADGPTLTAAAAATCLPAAAQISLPANYFVLGKVVRIEAQGRISNVITTPGTARFDVRLGGIVVFDTGALNLNTAAKTNVPWWLQILLTCRSAGPGVQTTLMGFAMLQSEALVGAPANSAGGNASLVAPVGAPVVGAGFDSTAAQALDLFFTQTVATGSLTLHTYKVESLN